jgi:hypothetical protein
MLSFEKIIVFIEHYCCILEVAKVSQRRRTKLMDMEEVYLRQITEYLKRQTELQEANNDLLKELLKKTGN